MKLWWLKLYTIPSFKKLAWPMVAWFMANVLCALFFPKIREITYLVAMYPWFVFMNDNENTISNNLDFHRVHMSYKELRRGLFIDISLQVMFFIFAFVLCSYVPWIYRGSEKQQEMLDLLGTPALAVPLLVLGTLLVFAMKLGKVKRLHDRTKKAGAFKTDKSGVVFLLTGLVGIFFVSHFKLGFYFGVFVFFAALSVIGLLNMFVEEFHLFPHIRKYTQFVEFPLALLTIFYFMSTGVPNATREISDTHYSPMQRFQTFGMYKNFGIVLDPETVTDFLTVSPYKKMVFDHAEAYVFEMDVDQLIKEPDFETYYYYLNSGKVSAHNLRALHQKTLVDAGVWKNGHFNNYFQKALGQYYPPAREIAAEKGDSK